MPLSAKPFSNTSPIKPRLGRFPTAVILLVCTWVTLFIALPNLLVLITSVLSRDEARYISLPLSLNGYAQLSDPLYWEVIWHSTYLAGSATLIALLIGYPFAYCLAQLPGTARNIGLFLVIVPFWTNSLIRTYAMKLLLGKKGLINSALLSTGIIDQPLNLLYTEFAVIFGLIYVMFPFMVLPLYANIEKLDRRLLEAARDLGASQWHRFTNIIIPLTSPGIVAGCLIVFLPSMGCFYVADLLGGSKNLLLGNIIKTQFLHTRDWPFGAALSITLMAIMTLLMLLYFWTSKRINQKGGLDDSTF
jgi:spermidine/putrescine transport system permease protein